MKKRLLALFLTFTMLLALCPTAVLADDQKIMNPESADAWTLEEPPIRDTEVIEVSNDYVPEGMVVQYDPPKMSDGDSLQNYELRQLQAICVKIRSALLSNTGNFSISLSEINLTNENEQFIHLGYYCPYFDGNNINVTLYTYSDTGKYAYLQVTNELSAEETAAWVDTIDAKLDELFALIDNDNLSLQDQALVLHDYMAVYYHYDTTYSDYYPSIMLTQKTGVCQSYSYLFQYLFNKKGVECYTTVTKTHAWNILRLGEQYYHVDVTWDDPITDKYGRCRHKYFLITDASIEDGGSHTSWDLANYACTDATYEDDYFAAAVSSVVIEGSKRYYFDSTALQCYDTETATGTTAATLSKWPVRDEEGYSWNGTYSGLWEDHGKLFYNEYNAIMTYDLATGTSAIFAEVDNTDGDIYGSLYEDGQISYVLLSSPNDAYTASDIHTIDYTPPHVWDDGTVTTPASCTEDGVMTYYCTICGIKGTAIIPAAGSHSYETVVTEPTCTEQGYTTYTCSVCGDSYVSDYVSMLGHDYADYTDNDDGTHFATCSRCGEIITEEHTWDEGTVTTEPTTEEEGVMTYTCTVCGAEMTEAIEKLPSEDSLCIVTQPDGGEATIGQTVTISFEAANAKKYQWLYSKDEGATWKKLYWTGFNTNALEVSYTSGRSAYQYRCLVTGTDGTTLYTDVTTITRGVAPDGVITQQPGSVFANVGDTVYFHIDAENVISYQWYYSKDAGTTWTKLYWEGAQTDTLTVQASTARFGYVYYCQLTDGNAKMLYSSRCYLRRHLSVTKQPQSVTANYGDSVNLTVSAVGVQSYQWYYSRDNGANWSKLFWTGFKSNTLTVAFSASNASYIYRCELVGYDDTQLTTDTVKVTKADEPANITVQPQNETAEVGDTVELSVTAENAASYQWYYSKDGGSSWYKLYWNGYNSDTLTVAVTEARMAYLYHCVVTGTDGTAVVSDSVSIQRPAEETDTLIFVMQMSTTTSTTTDTDTGITTYENKVYMEYIDLNDGEVTVMQLLDNVSTEYTGTDENDGSRYTVTGIMQYAWLDNADTLTLVDTYNSFDNESVQNYACIGDQNYLLTDNTTLTRIEYSDYFNTVFFSVYYGVSSTYNDTAAHTYVCCIQDDDGAASEIYVITPVSISVEYLMYTGMVDATDTAAQSYQFVRSDGAVLEIESDVEFSLDKGTVYRITMTGDKMTDAVALDAAVTGTVIYVEDGYIHIGDLTSSNAYAIADDVAYIDENGNVTSISTSCYDKNGVYHEGDTVKLYLNDQGEVIYIVLSEPDFL